MDTDRFEDNYEMSSPVEVIGEGGFAAVKICKRLKDGEVCAVKHVIFPFEEVQEDYSKTANNEFQMLMTLLGH